MSGGTTARASRGYHPVGHFCCSFYQVFPLKRRFLKYYWQLQTRGSLAPPSRAPLSYSEVGELGFRMLVRCFEELLLVLEPSFPCLHPLTYLSVWRCRVLQCACISAFGFLVELPTSCFPSVATVVGPHAYFSRMRRCKTQFGLCGSFLL